MKTLIVILILVFACTCFAGDSISEADHIIKPLVGKRVVVDGIAWGAFAKGLGERIVLLCGVKLYLTGKDYLAGHPEGKLIRITGKLTIKTQEPVSSPYEQGYTSRFQYYSIEVESFKVIDKAENAFPIEAK